MFYMSLFYGSVTNSADQLVLTREKCITYVNPQLLQHHSHQGEPRTLGHVPENRYASCVNFFSVKQNTDGNGCLHATPQSHLLVVTNIIRLAPIIFQSFECCLHLFVNTAKVAKVRIPFRVSAANRGIFPVRL